MNFQHPNIETVKTNLDMHIINFNNKKQKRWYDVYFVINKYINRIKDQCGEDEAKKYFDKIKFNPRPLK